MFSQVATEKHQRGELEEPLQQLVAVYSKLNRRYAESREENNSLRRYFAVSVPVPYTDVWMHKTVSFIPASTPAKNRQTC